MSFRTETREGPAFKALPNDRWRAFALIFCGQGRKNATQAYLHAFDKDQNDVNNSWCRRAASTILRDNRMQAAILEISSANLALLAPIAAENLARIASSPAHADNLKASLEIMNRVGMHAKTETLHRHENITAADQVTNISRLAAILGIDVAKLLGNRIEAPVIDVTPEPVAEISQPDEDEDW